MNNLSVRAQLRFSTALLVTVGSPVAAQISNAPAKTATGIEQPQHEQTSGDIVVTAQRRAERVQDVPITISVLDSATIEERHVNQLQDLTRLVPTFKTSIAPGIASVRLSIRGLGSTGNSAIEPSVATFLNDAYVPRAGSLYSSLLDVGSIEVVSGPQGTLYGRNASVGAINIRTNDPVQRFEGYIAGEGGTGDRYRLDGVINVPIGDHTAIRFAGLAEANRGLWRSASGNDSGLSTLTGRVTVKTLLGDSLTWKVTGDYTRQEGGGWGDIVVPEQTLTPATRAALTAKLGGAFFDTNINDNFTPQYTADSSVGSTHWGVVSNMAYEFGAGFTLRMINNYRNWRNDESTGDVTFSPLPLVRNAILFSSESNSHELQLSSPSSGLFDGRLRFVAGLYYYHEAFKQLSAFDFLSSFCSVIVPVPARPTCTAGAQSPAATYDLLQSTDSLAAYLQGSYAITKSLELTLGSRYTRDTKEGHFTGRLLNPTASAFQTNETSDLDYKQGRTTIRANLAWRPHRDFMLFATYSTGFKSGGFNSGNSPVVLGPSRIFSPETVEDYEAGFKFQTADRRLTLNATAFRMDIANYQERALSQGIITVVRNVGTIRDQGIEADMVVRPTKRLSANVSLVYLDNKFRSYPNAPGIPGISASQDLSGRRVTYSPEISGSAGVSYDQPLTRDLALSVRGDVSFTDKFYAQNTIDLNPLAIQESYALLSGRIALSSEQRSWTLSVFGENLTDKRYCANYGVVPLDLALGARNPTTGTALTCFVAPRRTLGVRGQIRF